MSTTPLKDRLVDVAISRVHSDKTEESLGSVTVGVLATDSAVNISRASTEISRNQVDTLKELAELGYDKDSDVAKDISHASSEIQKVLVMLAKAAAKHV